MRLMEISIWHMIHLKNSDTYSNGAVITEIIDKEIWC